MKQLADPVQRCRSTPKRAAHIGALSCCGWDHLDPDGDDITVAKLAVDRQIEHGEVASAALDLEFSSGSTRRVWVAAVILPLVGVQPESACTKIASEPIWTPIDTSLPEQRTKR